MKWVSTVKGAHKNVVCPHWGVYNHYLRFQGRPRGRSKRRVLLQMGIVLFMKLAYNLKCEVVDSTKNSLD